MENEAESTPNEAVDNYELAFSQATGEQPPAAATTEPAEAAEKPAETAATTEPAEAAEKPAETAGQPAATEKPAETAATTEPAEAAEKPAETAGQPATAAEAQPAPQLDPRYLAQAIAEEQERLRTAAQPSQQPEQQKPLTQADFLTPEDNAAMAKFKSEWPDEFPVIDRMIEAKATAIALNRVNELTLQLNGVLAPLFASTQKVEVNSHVAAIHAAHPDADAIVPAVVEWVKTQPTFLQPGYTRILKEGTAQEVIEVLGHYKQSVGKTSAAPAVPASPAPQPAAKPAPPAAAVAALAAVPAAQRPQVAAKPDESDFDSAFNEASVAFATS